MSIHLGFNTTFIGQSFKNSQLANQKVALFTMKGLKILINIGV